MATLNCGCRSILFLALCGTLAALRLAGPASAQSLDALREQCLAQYAYLRGPGQQGVVYAHVHACIEAKRKTGTASAGTEVQLIEQHPWLARNDLGPGDAKGVVYFVTGWVTRGNRDDWKLAPYILKTLSENGWDVIKAKIPFKYAGRISGVGVGSVIARSLPQRVKELKDKGYRRVVLFGHSAGAWAAMLAVRNGNPNVDALLLNSPFGYGPRTFENGRANPDFRKNLTEFGPLVDSIKTPTIMMFFSDAENYDPGERGPIAEKHFAQAGVPRQVIDNPPGITGQFGAWLPFFDFAYGKCIAAFLESPASEGCPLPRLSNDDFRSILDLEQVADADKKRITAAEALRGKTFTVYATDTALRHYDFVAPTRRDVIETDRAFHEDVSFRNGLLCTGSKCSLLISWSEHEILEFDPKTGGLSAWWIVDQ